MSVTFCLYKPRLEVQFKGFWWMQMPFRDMSHEVLMDLQVKLGGPSEPDKNAPYETRSDFFQKEMDWEDQMELTAWSDGKKHQLFKLDTKKGYLRSCRGGRRMLNRLSKFSHQHFSNEYYRFNYLVLDEVVYRQGWFLKKRFFRRKFWTVYGTTKEEVERFFNKYLKPNDEVGKEARDAFLNAWEDGMLFECAF